ncbi:trichohyalin-like [Puntigrus tetrazona]|uniref:trichohyalin-like n=1 Tax=Puntigrus tetrazona TaxID=1606681 RepID=UPI001C8A0C3F|nr:trichohyalin-like [Puntigrus tetrazona]
MSFNAEEYYRSVFDEQLASTIEDLEKESEEKTSSMLLAEDIEENRRATIALEEQEKELQGKRERLRERAEKVAKEKEELRQLKRDTAKELQENQAQKLQAIQHAKEEEEKIEKLEKSIEELTKRYEGLLEERQEQHRRRRQAKLNRESSAKMPGKFEDADRRRECRRAEYLRDENLRLKAELKEIDRSNLELQKDIKEEKTRILHLRRAEAEEDRAKTSQQKQKDCKNIHTLRPLKITAVPQKLKLEEESPLNMKMRSWNAQDKGRDSSTTILGFGERVGGKMSLDKPRRTRGEQESDHSLWKKQEKELQGKRECYEKEPKRWQRKGGTEAVKTGYC